MKLLIVYTSAGKMQALDEQQNHSNWHVNFFKSRYDAQKFQHVIPYTSGTIKLCIGKTT